MTKLSATSGRAQFSATNREGSPGYAEAVTGVGSSALGFVVLGYVEGAGQPVAAIVPGYGLADL